MRHSAYPKYKECGVQWLGRVPEYWEVKRGRFVTLVNPPAPLLRSLDDDSEISFVSMDAVHEYGGLRLDQTKIKAEVVGGYTEFQNGDVVIAKITPCFENGKGSLATSLVNGAAFGTTELHVLRSEKIDNRYLFFLTITDGYRKLGESEMYGAGGQKRVPPEFCKDFQTPVPPLHEQTAIADFLDRETGRIDGLVAKKRRLIELLREKRTALISRTVTRGLPADAAREFGLEPHARFKDSGIDWLGEVPEGWEIWKLSHGFQNTGSGTTPPSDNDAWYDGEIPWITTSELRESIILDTAKKVSQDAVATFSALKIFPKGSLAIAMYGATIGRLGILGVPATMNQACCVMYGERALTARFMFLWFQAFREQVILLASGGGQPNISQDKIRSIRVASPPLPEQTAIATYLDRETSNIDRLVEKVEAAVERLQEYRTALITTAVTGKIDVRNIESIIGDLHASVALS